MHALHIVHIKCCVIIFGLPALVNVHQIKMFYMHSTNRFTQKGLDRRTTCAHSVSLKLLNRFVLSFLLFTFRSSRLLFATPVVFVYFAFCC